jgi:hypothetical protein
LLGDQLADYLAAARAGQVRLSGYVLPTPFRRTCLLFVTADASMLLLVVMAKCLEGP